MLIHQIESGLHERQGKAVTNFSRTLPPEQSDLAREIKPIGVRPIGVASYTLEKELPHELKGALPAPEGIERALRGEAPRP